MNLVQLVLCAYLLLPMQAKALEVVVIKDPLGYSIEQYGLALGVAVLGGFVSWYAKVKRGEVVPWNIMALIGELSTAAFSGLLAFWICEWAGAPPLLVPAFVGIAGHMGARAITLFEEFAAKRWGEMDQKP